MKTLILMFAAAALCTSIAAAKGDPVTSDQFVLLPVKSDPTVSFRIWFQAGSQDDPKGKEGLAYITAQMVTDGATRKNSYEQVLEKLYPLAASYNAAVNVEMTVISGRTHKDNLKEYYALLTDALLEPAFLQADLDRIKSDILNSLENQLRYSSDEELGKAVLYGEIFRGTSYAHLTNGTIDAVKGITLDDVRSFYQSHYARNRVTIGLGGGYDQKLISDLKRDLGRFPAATDQTPGAPVPQPINGINVAMVEKDAPATAISFGFPINLVRGSKEWYALAIANSWLGEHRNSSSHLYQVIREKRGLNYGDYSYIEHYPGGGFRMLPPQNACRRQQIFEVWIRPVPNETRHFALRAAVREVKGLIANGLTQEEFDLTRKFLKKYVLNYAPTTMERLGYALDDKFYGIKGSHLEIYRSMMDKLTLNDVNAAVKKHLQTDNMRIAVITKDAASFRDALVGDLPSPISYKTPKPQEVLDEDKVIGTFPLKVPAERITIVPVTELFNK